MSSPRPHTGKSASTPTPEEVTLFESLWSSGGLSAVPKHAVSQHLSDRARHKGQPSSPSKARGQYGAWYMPTGDWKSVYGGSTADEESIQARMGKVSNAEVERRHQLEHQRAALQDELSKTYTVRVFREYVQERNVREPMVMANVTAASDGVIRARNAQHTLRENKAAGSRTATDSTLGAMAQLGAGEAGKIDKIGLTGGVRFLADGIRPSDLDIDEIIAPEMREMVRRTLAMNDRLREHAAIVQQMQQERRAKESEWAKTMSRAKKAGASGHVGTLPGKAHKSRSSIAPSVPTAAAAAGPAEGAGRALVHSSSMRLTGASGAGAGTVPASPAHVAGGSASPSGAQAAGPAEARARRSFELEGTLPTGGVFVTAHVPESHAGQSEGGLQARRHPYASLTVGTLDGYTPPGTPSPGMRGSRTPNPAADAAAAAAGGQDAEVPSLRLETLAGRSDLPFGVRYLAALGAATAGAPPPGSPMARKAEQQELQQAPFLDDKAKRWQHDRVPALHSAMQAAISAGAAAHAPPRTPTSPGASSIPSAPRAAEHAMHTYSTIHRQGSAVSEPCLAKEPTFGESGEDESEQGSPEPSAESNVGTTYDSHLSPHPHPSYHNHHHHHHQQHPPPAVAVISGQRPLPPHQHVQEEAGEGNLSLAWLSGERVRRSTDKASLNTRSGSSLGLASTSSLARQGLYNDMPQVRPRTTASSTRSPGARVNTAPGTAAFHARVYSPIPGSAGSGIDNKSNLRRLSLSEHQTPSSHLHSPTHTLTSPAGMGLQRRMAFEEL